MFSCSYHPKGWRFYYLQNNTEDTVFYRHAYIMYNTSTINTVQNTSVLLTIKDTILPNTRFHFATVERTQRYDAEHYSLAWALQKEGTYIPLDSTFCYLECQNNKHIIDPKNKESFFFTKNYERQEGDNKYIFYLREYLEKLEAAE